MCITCGKQRDQAGWVTKGSCAGGAVVLAWDRPRSQGECKSGFCAAENVIRCADAGITSVSSCVCITGVTSGDCAMVVFGVCSTKLALEVTCIWFMVVLAALAS